MDNKEKNFLDKVKDFITNTPDYTAEYLDSDIQGQTVMGILCYLGILVIIPILARKKNPYVRFHANQGLMVCIASVIASALGRYLIGSLLGLIVLAFVVLGFVNVINERAKELPLIGKFHLIA